MSGTVIFLGAGATKSCGGPLTNEILPQMLAYSGSAAGPVPDSTGRLPKLRTFLEQVFHVNATIPKESFPGLPLLMSLLDSSLDRRQSLHPAWDNQALAEIREAIELGIFDALEDALRRAPTNNHWELLQKLFPVPFEPTVISTNYDLIVDTALMSISETRGDGMLPDYRCAISTSFYKNENAHYGTLLKLHGSLNWLYCRTCHRLEIGASDSRRYLKALNKLVGPTVEQMYTADGSPCPICKTRLRPLLIAPTHLKDYRNPHLSQVWYEAEQVLRDSSRIIFIGYSLPDDDVEVVHLLKRSTTHLTSPQITVVEYDDAKPPLHQHPVGRRYRTLFGDGIDWHPEGIDAWLLSGSAMAAAGG